MFLFVFRVFPEHPQPPRNWLPPFTTDRFALLENTQKPQENKLEVQKRFVLQSTCNVKLKNKTQDAKFIQNHTLSNENTNLSATNAAKQNGPAFSMCVFCFQKQ